MICAVNKTTLKVEFFNNFMDTAALTDGNQVNMCTVFALTLSVFVV